MIIMIIITIPVVRLEREEGQDEMRKAQGGVGSGNLAGPRLAAKNISLIYGGIIGFQLLIYAMIRGRPALDLT
jgi:putative exporter of polyketide antibiotics